MPELELGLAVGAWSIDTDTGDERGSGGPPAIDGTVASRGGGAPLTGTTIGKLMYMVV